MDPQELAGIHVPAIPVPPNQPLPLPAANNYFDGELHINPDNIELIDGAWDEAEEPPHNLLPPLLPPNENDHPVHVGCLSSLQRSLRRRGRVFLSTANSASRAARSALSSRNSGTRSPPTARRRLGTPRSLLPRFLLNIIHRNQRHVGDPAEIRMETLEFHPDGDGVLRLMEPPPLNAPPSLKVSDEKVSMHMRVYETETGSKCCEGSWMLSSFYPAETCSYTLQQHGNSLAEDYSGMYDGSFIYNGEMIRDVFDLYEFVRNNEGSVNVRGRGRNDPFGHFVISGILVYKQDENDEVYGELDLNREYVSEDGGRVELNVEINDEEVVETDGQVVETNDQVVEQVVETNDEAVGADDEEVEPDDETNEREGEQAAGTTSSTNNTGKSVEDTIPADVLADYRAKWRNRTKGLPRRRNGDPEENWQETYGISLEQLQQLRAAAIDELNQLKKDHPNEDHDQIDYFIALIKILYPGDMLFLILLHCPLQWSRGHVSFNCGGGSIFGDDVALGDLRVCTLDGLIGLNPFFERYSSFIFGPVAGGLLGINGRQGYCPTLNREYAPCPPLQENETSPKISVEALSILLKLCDKLKAPTFMFSAAGTSTKVNDLVKKPLADSLEDLNYITIAEAVLHHAQYLRRGIPGITLMETSLRMSRMLQQLSNCLSSHLKNKCGVSLGEGESLHDLACDSPALPMINNGNPSEESLTKLVKSSRVEALAIILFHCKRHKLSLAKDGPPEVRAYAFHHYEEIKAREEGYKNEGKRDLVPDSPEEVTCFHILSNLGKNSWESLSEEEKKDRITAMQLAREEAKKKTYDESILDAFRINSIEGIVDHLSRVPRIVELAAKIAGMRFGGDGNNSTFSLSVSGYKNRRSVADNPGSDRLRVVIQWKDDADTTKKDSMQKLMKDILDQGLEHDFFKLLPWWEIKASLLTVFGVDLEFEDRLRKEIKDKSGVDDIVTAIKNMWQISVLEDEIAGMSLSVNASTSTFSLSVSGYKNRRSVADNPGSDRQYVFIQWKDDADTTKKDSMQKLMKDILGVWLEHNDFKLLPYWEIKASLLSVFGVDLEFEDRLRKEIKDKSGVDDIVTAIKNMWQISVLEDEIAGMSLSTSNKYNSTFSLYVLGYKNRRSVADNPGSDRLRVFIQWKDDADTTKKDSMQKLMRVILKTWLDHDDFKNLPWREIEGNLCLPRGSPPKAAIRSPKDCKKPAASVAGNPFLSSERSNDDRYMKMSADRKVVNSPKKKPSSSNKGNRKRSGRQISIFESIGAAPPTEKVLTPPNSGTGGKGIGDSEKKKRRRTISQPNCGEFPICVDINPSMEGKEPKKVVITCHGVKSEYKDAFSGSSPIVVKEKHALPKDPLRRFLGGFGRYCC